MAVLRNIRHELFARNIAKGLPKSRAYELAGYRPDRANAINLYANKGTTSYRIQERVRQLVESNAVKDLRPDDILNRILAVYDLAIESNQCAPALKAMEMIGKQQFSMFTERRENININIASMSKAQLDAFLVERYGDKAKDLMAWLQSNSGFISETPVSEINPNGVARTHTGPPMPRLVYSSTE